MLRHSRLAKKSRRCGLNNEFAPFAPFIEPMAEIARVFFEKLSKSGLIGDANSPDPLKKGSDAQTFESHALNPNYGDIGRLNKMA